jgi:uncharacterized membrane protein
MNWKLIFQLSLFGLAMGISTVYWIPSNIEPFFWLAIFIICAYLIARNCREKFFLHGFFVSLVNCVWVTGAHVLLFQTYANNHPKEIGDMLSMLHSNRPRLLMLITGPIIGLIAGLVLGLFAFIASRIWKSRVTIS